MIVVVFLCLGCNRQSKPINTDHSQAGTASVLLGDPAKERGHGLSHIQWARDGKTTVTTLDGKPCRHVKIPQPGLTYFYFMIDPNFKKQGLKEALIEVEYYDIHAGVLDLDYDASKTLPIPNAAFTRAESPVSMKGTKTWQMAVFRIRNATFNNAQNAGGDFRLTANTPELYVRRVAVTHEDRMECLGQEGPVPKDFSRDNTVTLLMGDTEREYGTGLQHLYFDNEGITQTEVLDGIACRHLKATNGSTAYLSFILDPTFKNADVRNVSIEVEYMNDKAGAIGLEYDARKSLRDVGSAYKRAQQVLLFDGTMEWQTATFYAQDASFKNNQNSKADFRIWVFPSELYIRRVTIKRGIPSKAADSLASKKLDFSKTNRISLLLGYRSNEIGQGLRHIDWEKDGLTVVTNINEEPCRCLAPILSGKGYFYFSVDPTFKKRTHGDMIVEIEYFEQMSGTFGIEYDASPDPEHSKDKYTIPGNPITLQALKRWQKASVRIHNPTFHNSQNAGADFRFIINSPAFYVRRVSISRLLSQQ
jgi:hypothetical protein